MICFHNMGGPTPKAQRDMHIVVFTALEGAMPIHRPVRRTPRAAHPHAGYGLARKWWLHFFFLSLTVF
jgi:hypothetical protein